MFERTSGLHECVGIVHRMGMPLEGKVHGFLQIEGKTLQRVQSVQSVNDTLYTLEDDIMEGVAAAKAAVLSLSSLLEPPPI